MTNVPEVIYRCEVDADWTMVGIGDDIERDHGLPAVGFRLQLARRPGSEAQAASIRPQDEHDRVATRSLVLARQQHQGR